MLLSLIDKYDVGYESDCPKNKGGGGGGWGRQKFPSCIFWEGELALDSFLYCALFLNQNINALLTAALKEAEVR